MFPKTSTFQSLENIDLVRQTIISLYLALCNSAKSDQLLRSKYSVIYKKCEYLKTYMEYSRFPYVNHIRPFL